MNFIWVIFAHFIGDWALQNDFLAQNKSKYWFVMFAHCMVWTATISIALQYLGIFAMWKVLFLLIGHWVVDKWKCMNLRDVCSKSKEIEKHNLALLYADQFFHFIQCVVVYIV